MEKLHAYVDTNNVKIIKNSFLYCTMTFNIPVKKIKYSKIIVDNKDYKIKRIRRDENPYSLNLVITPRRRYKVITLEAFHSLCFKVVFYKEDKIIDVPVHIPQARIFTKIHEDNYKNTDTLCMDLIVYNGKFNSAYFDYFIETDRNSEVKYLNKHIVEVKKVNYNKYIFKLNIKNSTKKLINGKLHIKQLSYNNILGEQFSEDIELPIYYKKVKDNPIKENIDPRYKLLLLNASGNAETLYDKVMGDKFPWQKLVSTCLSVIGIGAGGIGSCVDGSCGSATASIVGMVTNLIGGILGMTESSPIDAIKEKLDVISGQLSDLSQQLAELTNYLRQMTDHIYKGVDRIVYLSYAQNWDKFNSMLENVLSTERSMVAQIKDYFYHWIKFNTITNLKFNFASAYDARGIKGNDFGLVTPKYDSDFCTDDVLIERDFIVQFNIPSVFKTVMKNINKGYYNDFTKDFIQDIKNSINEFGWLDNPYIIINNKKELFEKYVKSINNNSEVFATQTLTVLSAYALKSIFTNDIVGKNLAISFNNLVIELFKSFAGISTAGGVSPKFTDYYNLLYNKYSFQNEAEEHIKNFRISMKDKLYHFCSLAKAAADLYPGLDLLPQLKDAYEKCNDVFVKNDGLFKLDEKKIEKRTDIFGYDYCYVTGSFISMNVVASNINGDAKSKEETGAQTTNLVLNNINGKLKYVETDIRSLPLIGDIALTHILDRKSLNYSNEVSAIDFFKKAKVLDGQVSYNLRIKTDNQYAITTYTGLQKVGLSTYKQNPIGECFWKLEGTDYFVIGGKYKLKDFVHGKEWYHAFRTVADVYDINSCVKVSDNLGHIFWHNQQHWYWKTDEVWCFREDKNYRYYYCLYHI